MPLEVFLCKLTQTYYSIDRGQRLYCKCEVKELDMRARVRSGMFVSVWLLYLNLSPVQIKNTVSTEAVLESWHMLRGESRSHKHCFFSSKSFKLFMKELWRACACKVLWMNISRPKFWFKTSLFLLNLKAQFTPKQICCHHLIALM